MRDDGHHIAPTPQLPPDAPEWAGVLVDILSRRADHLSRQLDQALDEVAEIRSMIVGMSASKDISAPLDSAQAAGRLNISRRKLDELVAGGHLRPLRVGRKRLFPQEQLDSFLRLCER